jgi:hypothetical protein
MKNNLQIFLLIIYLNFILNKIKDIEYIFTNLNSPFDDLTRIEYENKNKFDDQKYKITKISENCTRYQLNIMANEEYCFNFSNLYHPNKEDILLYTDLYDVQDKISQIDLFKNNNSDQTIIFKAKGNKNGFIDAKKINKGLFGINKNITREEFYKGAIKMFPNETEIKFYINYIPLDNNSDLYFFQTNKSSVRDENKDNIILYYFNDFQSFQNKTLEDLYNHMINHPMKRERYINGKVEIFGYNYSELTKNISIKKGYEQIKGDGIIGPSVSLSVLFAALVVVVAIFIKNTYCDTGYRKRLSELQEDE